MLVNALRGHLAEFGIVASRGLNKVKDLVAVIADENDGRLPTSARSALRLLAAELAAIDRHIGMIETEIVARMRADLVARRLATIPGIGPIIAARITAVVPEPSVFRSGRDFAAWIGLVPRQNSSGGKSRLCGISKRGNGDLRRLLVGGAMAAMFRAKVLRSDPWLCRLRSRKPTMLPQWRWPTRLHVPCGPSCGVEKPGGGRRDLLDRTSLPPCSPGSRPSRLRWTSAGLDPGCATDAVGRDEKRSLGRTGKLMFARAKRADGWDGQSVDPTERAEPEVSQGTSIPAN
jgi:hypothetical protein